MDIYVNCEQPRGGVAGDEVEEEKDRIDASASQAYSLVTYQSARVG